MSARTASGLAACLTLALSVAAQAQTAGPSPAPGHMPVPGMTVPDMAARAARRFPQPVRVGDLAGRLLLQPEESQPVLGRVTGLVRRGDGALEVVVRLDGAWGLGWLGLQRIEWSGVRAPPGGGAGRGGGAARRARRPDGPDARAPARPAEPRTDSVAEIPPDATIRVGIVRPFH